MKEKREKKVRMKKSWINLCVSLASFKHTRLSVHCGTILFSIWKFIFVKLSILNKITVPFVCFILSFVSFNMLYDIRGKQIYTFACIQNILHQKSILTHYKWLRNERKFRHNMHIKYNIMWMCITMENIENNTWQ